MKESYYFAYGSNMNLDQMAYRCPAASVVEKVKLEGYRLTFCGRERMRCCHYFAGRGQPGGRGALEDHTGV